jgi:hypothetical protein
VLSELFTPTPEGEARVLLLIDAFSTRRSSLEGRTKLAKLDFLLRYPPFLRRALAVRAPQQRWPLAAPDEDNIENRMIRYRYGPWDPSYFAILGRLFGKGLVELVPIRGGLGFRSTHQGSQLAARLAATEPWAESQLLIGLLRRHFNLSGATLKSFVYGHFPEVAAADWGEEL